MNHRNTETLSADYADYTEGVDAIELADEGGAKREQLCNLRHLRHLRHLRFHGSDEVRHAVFCELQKAAMVGDGPIPAVHLAESAGITGNRESRRRIVRFAVEALRGPPIGCRICANHEGYWLARDSAEWADYLESRKRGACFEFVRERRMREAASEVTSGQERLF